MGGIQEHDKRWVFQTTCMYCFSSGTCVHLGHCIFCFAFGWPPDMADRYSILKIGWVYTYIQTTHISPSVWPIREGSGVGSGFTCVVWTFCGSDLSSLSSVKKRFLTDWKRVWASTPRTSAYRSAIMWMFSVFGPLWSLLTNATNKKIIGIFSFFIKSRPLNIPFPENM